MLHTSINAQHNRYWVFLTDKHNVKFNPYKYFDKKAIERRKKMSLSLYDTTDFPLNTHYVTKVKKIAEKLNCQLRWFNAVSVTASDYQIEKIKQLPFVGKVEQITGYKAYTAGDYDTSLRIDENIILRNQIKLMEGNLFADAGLTGKNIRIAIFDAGFPMIDKILALKHLINNKQIVATWDFAKEKATINSNNSHGTMVLSTITGQLNGNKIGLATNAEFLLARTEVDRTSIVEEEYWMQAVEWADKNGADIINSSLAYTYERYNTFDMNGKTSLIAKAAKMATDKGILVINAMGNDGNHDWKIMATPADVEEVLSVGAIDYITNFHAGFSSYGPTADYRLKPNLVASGYAVVACKKGLKKVKGTSFSAALISGFAACAWQKMPELTNKQIFDKLQQSASLYPYFDYAHGYGVPKASYFLRDSNYTINKIPTFEFKTQGDTIWIEVKKEYINKHYLKNNNYLYYHIENEQHYLSNYWLIDVHKQKAAYILKSEYSKAKVLRSHYKGYTNSVKLK